MCKLILLIGLVAPPWMLFVKPLLLKRDADEKKRLREYNGGDYEMA